MSVPNTDSASQPRALVTGIAGQDGSYLAELLVGKGYRVDGVIEGDPARERPTLAGVRDVVTLHDTDLTDRNAVNRLIELTEPDEIYNLAAPSVVPASWIDPIATLGFMTASVVCLLDAIVKLTPQTRFFQASSSEIFRDAHSSPQNEETTPRPTSPYGVGKLAGHNLVHAYREHDGVHASSGILYNHESPRRPTAFVTQKIVNAAVEIKLGTRDKLQLGDTSAQRDWGFAPDYVKAMWQMLQAETPSDYVIATGKLHTVQDLIDTAFELVGLDVADHVETDPTLVRAGDEALLLGDPTKAAEQLGWTAETSFEQFLSQMVDAELAARGGG